MQGLVTRNYRQRPGTSSRGPCLAYSLQKTLQKKQTRGCYYRVGPKANIKLREGTRNMERPRITPDGESEMTRPWTRAVPVRYRETARVQRTRIKRKQPTAESHSLWYSGEESRCGLPRTQGSGLPSSAVYPQVAGCSPSVSLPGLTLAPYPSIYSAFQAQRQHSGWVLLTIRQDYKGSNKKRHPRCTRPAQTSTCNGQDLWVNFALAKQTRSTLDSSSLLSAFSSS